MPSHNEIVSLINSSIQSILTGAEFQKGAYYGIAESLPRNNPNGTADYLPCVVSNNDIDTWVGIDDKFPIIIYHKTNTIASSLWQTQYGDGRIVNESSNMSIIIFADRAKLKTTKEDLYAAIISAMPITLTKSQLQQYKLRSFLLAAENPNFNSVAVYQNEYKRNTYDLKPNNIFFSIGYRMEMKYEQSCFALCDC